MTFPLLDPLLGAFCTFSDEGRPDSGPFSSDVGAFLTAIDFPFPLVGFGWGLVDIAVDPLPDSPVVPTSSISTTSSGNDETDPVFCSSTMVALVFPLPVGRGLGTVGNSTDAELCVCVVDEGPSLET